LPQAAPSSPEKLEKLKSLPYLNWAPLDKNEKNKIGVTKFDSELSYKGVNIYCSRGSSGGLMMDMNGRILHEIVDRRKEKEGKKGGQWHLVEPYLNNGFLAIIENKEIFLMNWDLSIKWRRNLRAHHDIDVAENGDIFTLAWKRGADGRIRKDGPIIDNKIVILNREGKIIREISLAEVVAKNKKLSAIALNKKQIFQGYLYDEHAINIFHANTVEIIRRDVNIDLKKIFKKGDILFCCRNLNTIGVLDLEKEEIVWEWGADELDCPHNPSLLENGNILVFDNGAFRKYSRVLELNPESGKIIWEYKATPPGSFFSRTMGSAQRLPNGNTLITEGEKGHVFEITFDGKIVWEFYNPELKLRSTKESDYERGTIYRMIRLPGINVFFDVGFSPKRSGFSLYL